MKNKETIYLKSLTQVVIITVVVNLFCLCCSNLPVYLMKYRTYQRADMRLVNNITYLIWVYSCVIAWWIFVPFNYRYLAKNGLTKDSPLKRRILLILLVVSIFVQIASNIINWLI